MSLEPQPSSAAIKEYLRNGTLPDLGDQDVSLNLLQALYLRRQARLVDQGEILSDQSDEAFTSAGYRQMSREALASRNTVINPAVLERIFANPEPVSEGQNLDEIVSFLHTLGYEQGGQPIPVFTTTPPALLNSLRQHFTLRLISPDQVNITDFGNILSESEIPDWFREIMDHRAETEYVNVLSELKDRWFLFLMISLAMASVVGNIADWGLEISRITQDFIFYLTIYGGVAVGRSIEQTRRAENWNRQAQSYHRPYYVDTVIEMAAEIDPELAAEFEAERDQLLDIFSWEEFKAKLGLKEWNHPEKKSLVDRLVEAIEAEPDIDNWTSDDFINELARRRIEAGVWPEGAEEKTESAPTVAVVIPAYQVSVEGIGRLLASIKDQAYPVTSAYVVYNDDPNETTEKQAEFLEYQGIVDAANAAQGRNECRVYLLAQPSRGKREAMAMGFTAAMGSGYPDQLVEQYLDDYIAAELQKDPAELEEELREKLTTMVANVDFDQLPDIKHDYILNIDADTTIADPMAVLNSVIMMQNHAEAGCITGDVRVETRSTNLLTEMTYQRYWIAFFKERAAQSNTGEVTCMSGPWVFMDADKLGQILPEWYFFEHVAGRATFGDDRDISTRMLAHGYESLFNPDSAVWTDCPDDYKTWLKQQLRWNKSFNIYNMVLMNFIHKLDKFVQADVLYQQAFPFALLFILASVSVNAVDVGMREGVVAGVETTLPYAATVLLYNELFFGVYGALRNKVENDQDEYVNDLKFLMSPVYIYYHFRHLLWVKLYAFYDLFIKGNTDWGTKGAEFDEAKLEQFAGEVAREIYDSYTSDDGSQFDQAEAPLPDDFSDEDLDTRLSDLE